MGNRFLAEMAQKPYTGSDPTLPNLEGFLSLQVSPLPPIHLSLSLSTRQVSMLNVNYWKVGPITDEEMTAVSGPDSLVLSAGA